MGAGYHSKTHLWRENGCIAFTCCLQIITFRYLLNSSKFLYIFPIDTVSTQLLTVKGVRVKSTFGIARILKSDANEKCQLGVRRHLFTVDFFATQGGVLTDLVNISYINLFFPIIYFQSQPYYKVKQNHPKMPNRIRNFIYV